MLEVPSSHAANSLHSSWTREIPGFGLVPAWSTHVPLTATDFTERFEQLDAEVSLVRIVRHSRRRWQVRSFAGFDRSARMTAGGRLRR
jgi:hypothetical protein